jgi:hypothetical protein
MSNSPRLPAYYKVIWTLDMPEWLISPEPLARENASFLL